MLSVKEIHVARNRREILRGVNLRVEAGQIRVLVGASGAGKTTLLRVIAGLEAPRSGHLEINGRLATDGPAIRVPPHRREVALVFQDGAIWPHLTVEQHLRFGPRRRSDEAEDRDRLIDNVLSLAGLQDRRRERPSHLSGGERQRLGLARALAASPRLLLLDEPLAHIDIPAQRALATETSRWIEKHGITALWVTHRPGEVAFVGGSVSVLAEGRIATELSPEEVPGWLSSENS